MSPFRQRDTPWYCVAAATFVGGTMAELATIPICSLKTIVQTSSLSVRQAILSVGCSDPVDVVKFSARVACRNLWRASVPAVFAQALSISSKLVGYTVFREILPPSVPNAACGAIGGILGGFVAYPADVWKNYRQRGVEMHHELIRLGPRMLYRGFSKGIVKNAILYAMLFPCYEFYRRKLPDQPAASAVLTTLTITAILQPFDAMKVRQAAGMLPIGTRHLSDAFRVLYKGCTLHLLRSIPHFAISMTITEHLLSRWKK